MTKWAGSVVFEWGHLWITWMDHNLYFFLTDLLFADDMHYIFYFLCNILHSKIFSHHIQANKIIRIQKPIVIIYPPTRIRQGHKLPIPFFQLALSIPLSLDNNRQPNLIDPIEPCNLAHQLRNLGDQVYVIVAVYVGRSAAQQQDEFFYLGVHLAV